MDLVALAPNRPNQQRSHSDSALRAEASSRHGSMALTILLSAGMSTHSANTQVYSSAADRTMCVWDGRTRECLRILRSGHSSYIRGLSPMRTFWRGHLMWSFSGDKTMRCALTLSAALSSRLAVCVGSGTHVCPPSHAHARLQRAKAHEAMDDGCVCSSRERTTLSHASADMRPMRISLHIHPLPFACTPMCARTNV